MNERLDVIEKSLMFIDRQYHYIYNDIYKNIYNVIYNYIYNYI